MPRFAEELARRLHIDAVEAEEALEELTGALHRRLADGDPAELPGLGRLVPHDAGPGFEPAESLRQAFALPGTASGPITVDAWVDVDAGTPEEAPSSLEQSEPPEQPVDEEPSARDPELEVETSEPLPPPPEQPAGDEPRTSSEETSLHEETQGELHEEIEEVEEAPATSPFLQAWTDDDFGAEPEPPALDEAEGIAFDEQRMPDEEALTAEEGVEDETPEGVAAPAAEETAFPPSLLPGAGEPPEETRGEAGDEGSFEEPPLVTPPATMDPFGQAEAPLKPDLKSEPTATDQTPAEEPADNAEADAAYAAAPPPPSAADRPPTERATAAPAAARPSAEEAPRRRWWIPALVLLVLVAIAAVWLINRPGDEAVVAPPVAEEASPPAAGAEQPPADEPVAETPADEPAPEPTAPANTFTGTGGLSPALGGWTVIVGYGDEAAMRARAEALRAEGLLASVVYGSYAGSAARYRLGVGQFESRAAAIAAQAAEAPAAVSSVDGAWPMPIDNQEVL